MDQIRSFVGDPVPTVPQHTLVTRPESLRWWVLHLRLQPFDHSGYWGSTTSLLSVFRLNPCLSHVSSGSSNLVVARYKSHYARGYVNPTASHILI